MGDARPLVSIGLPVRNGAEGLPRVLEGLVGQTYANIEIHISDNASSDETERLCRAAAARDPRITYIRQPRLLSVLDNWRATVEAARGALFMFAAHDDFRSLNYVETLVQAFHDHPEASLAFSDVVEFANYDEALQLPRLAHDFETSGLNLIARLRKQTRNGCDHVYGLIKTEHLRSYAWREDVSWDVAFLAYLAVRGPMVYVPGATFYYRSTAGQTIEARARETSRGRVHRLQTARTAWLTARAIADAHRRQGEWRPAALTFPAIFYFSMQGVRGIVSSLMPGPMRTALRRQARSTRA
jgi:glycosyltransferase involved in cell wall biosynthesis